MSEDQYRIPLWECTKHIRRVTGQIMRSFVDFRDDYNREVASPEDYDNDLPPVWRGQSSLFRLYRRAISIELETEYREGEIENSNDPDHDEETWGCEYDDPYYEQREYQIEAKLLEGSYQPYQEDLERAAFSLVRAGVLGSIDMDLLDAVIGKAPCRNILDIPAHEYRKKRREVQTMQREKYLLPMT